MSLSFFFLALSLFLSTTWAFNPCVLEGTNQHQQERVLRLGPAQQAPALGPYKTQEGNIPHMPGLTMGGQSSAGVVYPTPKTAGEKFPFISFAHGTGVSQPLVDYKTALHTVASYGFIVVAVRTCPKLECASPFSHDQLQAITACKNNTKLHKSLATADFSTVGVFGHSMGGMSTLACAGGGGGKIDPSRWNIKAAVSQHPCQDVWTNGRGVKIPIMFTAGSVDKICADGCSAQFFAAVPSKHPKVLFDIKGVNHFEPTNIGDNCEMEAVALFLSCQLRGDNCDKVYGTSGKEICSQLPKRHSMFNCTVQGHS